MSGVTPPRVNARPRLSPSARARVQGILAAQLASETGLQVSAQAQLDALGESRPPLADAQLGDRRP